jgi:hypothetical protein
MTKKAKLLKLMQRQWVSPIKALQDVGILSLSQRVGEFKRAGVNVQTRWARSAAGARFCEYRVVKG